MNKAIYGILLIENVNSNPNGDPDNDGAPRTFEGTLTGAISAVSIKRKLRDHILLRTPTFLEACEKVGITPDEIQANYNIYVEPSKTAEEYKKILSKDPDNFLDTYVDARVFGNTLLGSEDETTKKDQKPKPRAGGPFYINMAESLQPIETYIGTTTRAQGMDGNKTQGIAPDSMKLVRYGLYMARFGFHPDTASIHRTRDKDVALIIELLPHIYNFKAANRSGTEVIQVWSLQKPLCLPLSHAKFEELVSPKLKDTNNDKVPAENRKDYVFPTKESVLKIIDLQNKLQLQVIDLV